MTGIPLGHIIEGCIAPLLPALRYATAMYQYDKLRRQWASYLRSEWGLDYRQAEIQFV